MKIVIAPDSFKGSIDAFSVAKAIRLGVQAIFPDAEIVLCPLADGGEGSGEVWASYLNAKKVVVYVQDPLGRNIESHYYLSIDGRAALIDSSLAAGLILLSTLERNPGKTSTYGVGQLIDNAIFAGAEQIYLTLGGSATNDMGIGMAAALGYKFSNKDPYDLATTGENLVSIEHISIHESAHNRIRKIKFDALCDVINPLYGPAGAAFVYGAQKGADSEMVKRLDVGTKHFDQICMAHEKYNLSDLDVNKLHAVQGAGAAGGLGYGAMYFLGAKLLSGIETLLDLAGFDEIIKDADLIITGEGKIDNQTINGKLISGIIKRAKVYNVPVFAICGQCTLEDDKIRELGLQKVVPLATTEEEIRYSFEHGVEQVVTISKTLF